MTSITYGTVPSRSQFMSAFKREMEASPRGVYEITLRGWDARRMDTVYIAGWHGNGDYAADELYALTKGLIKAWDGGNEWAGDLASSILYTLQIEWV